MPKKNLCWNISKLVLDAGVVRNRVFCPEDAMQPADTVKNPVSVVLICPGM
jgi:hypothetical protein